MDPRVPEHDVPSGSPRVRAARGGGTGRRHPQPPLPPRDGVPPARFSMPIGGSWGTVAEFLQDRSHGAPEVGRRLAAGEVLLGDGTVVTEHTAYRPGQWVYLHRDPPPETPVPGELTVVHEDERILVVDKPHFLATMPRGTHVRETVLARLRRQPGWEQAQPAHRLDRLTAGVLLVTKDAQLRRVYQELFAARSVEKTYRAVVAAPAATLLPDVVRSRVEKPRGQVQAVQVPAGPGIEVNAITYLQVVQRSADRALLELRPMTGRTHQLRVQLAGLGAPIVGDTLYPRITRPDPGDFRAPLQLLAAELAFTDPVTGVHHTFRSQQSLAFP